MRNILTITILAALLALSACNKKHQEAEALPDNSKTPKALAPALPAYPQDQLARLITQVTDLDVQSLNHGFSMNVGDGGAQQQLRSILPQPAERVPCTEEFYIFATGNGEQLAHIGLFMGQGCYYAVFYDNNVKATHANAVDPRGLGFFAQMLQQVKTVPGGGQ